MQSDALARLPTQNSEFASKAGISYPPLNEVSSPTVTTSAAAYYLNRRPQTLRDWACFDKGPIKPTRVNGRLHWSVSTMRQILGVAEAA